MPRLRSFHLQDLADSCMAYDRRARPVFASVVGTLDRLLAAAQAGELQALRAVPVYHQE